MIFYFTGTGNSQYVAQNLLAADERLIGIKEAVDNSLYHYETGKGERVGFVFPVYFGGLPTILIHFIRRLVLEGERPAFLYAVMTNGGGPMAADRMFRKHLESRAYPVDEVFSLTMPDNCFLYYDVASEEEESEILAGAEEDLVLIKNRILDRTKTDVSEENRPDMAEGYRSGIKEQIFTRTAYPFYIRGRRTKKFWVDDQCVSCYACQNRCPAHAIRLIDGKPTWVKDRCVLCLGCMRCGAIHYGKADGKHGRYKHPVFRKKAQCHDH